jgi:hypothetical protein
MISRLSQSVKLFFCRPKASPDALPYRRRRTFFGRRVKYEMPLATPPLVIRQPSTPPPEPCVDFATHYAAAVKAYRSVDYDLAKAEIDKAIWCEPNNFMGYLQRGKTKYFQGRLQDANDDFWRSSLCRVPCDYNTETELNCFSGLTTLRLKQCGLPSMPRY